jgi:hypothetical protein
MVSSDRREFQRLRLGKPILGLLDDQNALILDIGVSGAYVEHYGKPQPGSRMTLLFRWKGEDLGFLCDVSHTDVVRNAANDVVSHSGLRFLEPIGHSESRLNDMVATFIGKILAAQRANAAAGDSSESGTLVDLGGARRARSRNFVSYRYENGVWSRAFTDSAAQPENGFTVAGYEDDDELQTLCESYVAADEEGRRLIRLVAELSARTVKRGS